VTIVVSANIEAILIIQSSSGVPLLLQKMNPKALDIDPALISGFLYAIKSFSSEVLEKGSDEFQIDYGKKIFNVFTGNHTLFVAVSVDGWNESMIPLLREVIAEFENRWYIEKDVQTPGEYDGFRRTIIERIGLQGLSMDWIPFYRNLKQPGIELRGIETLIDGENSIMEIVDTANGNSEENIAMLANMWAADIIGFKNLLDDSDMIIPTQSLTRFIQSNTKERSELAQFSEELVNLLPRVLKYFDGKTTVEEILEEQPKELYSLLDYLLRRQAIEVLSSEKKRILLAKEVLAKTLQVSDRVYSKTNTLMFLRAALKKVRNSEIIADIHVTFDSWNIEYGFMMYDGLSPNRIMEIHDAWISVIRNLIRSLPKRNRMKFIEGFADTLQEDFFDRYARDELDGIEKITHDLESELA
jgi:hypothetical protein